MKYLKYLVPIIFVLISTMSYAQTQVTVDLSKLSSTARDEILRKQNNTPEQKVEKIKEYVSIGKEIGIALSETCKVLNVEINSFVTTPVGKFVLVIIVWKVFGSRLAALFILFLAALGLFYSMKLFFWGIKKKDKDGTITYEKYDFYSSEARAGCGLIHVIAFIVVVGFSILILLV